jgi:hypothetical protein
MSPRIKTKGDIEAAFNRYLNTLPVPDKKRRRASFFAPVQRFWVRNPAGGVVRWLSVSRYSEDGEERQYNLRLASNDPRPLGIEIGKTSKGFDDAARAFYCRNHGRLPLNTWVEIEYAPHAAPKPPLLLTWPDMKGAA